MFKLGHMMSSIEEGPVYTSYVSSKNWLEVWGGGGCIIQKYLKAET